MEDSFEGLSRNIANDFLRDIVFIDECAYCADKPDAEQSGILVNAFNASEVSTAFCRAGKICAIYAPKKDTDINICIEAVKKADAVVLDWNLKLEQTMAYNPMEDAKDDERGQYTKKIIDKILEDAGDSKMKLIIVYTGESNLDDINGQICKEFSKYNLRKTEQDIICCKKNIRIVVRAKDTAHFNHVEQYRDKIVKYEALPEEIVRQFAQLTIGLLSNYALAVITIIRNNISNILGVFSRDIDAAFLGHYVSVDNSDDAVFMLSELFGAAISDLIKSENIKIKLWIELWIDYFASDNRNISLAGKSINVTPDFLKSILRIPNGELYKKIQATGLEVPKHKEPGYKKEAIRLFSSDLDTETSNYKLAQLIQHKNIFSSVQTIHKLSAGTIVKLAKNNTDRYLLCIQQRCDSVRLSDGERRNFLFLPLEEEETGGEAIVVNMHKHLMLNKKSYALELYTFSGEAATQVMTQNRDGKMVFVDVDDNLFEWVAELKELFAQHLVAMYAAELSRVGVDNSEWIRLMGK